MRYFAVLLVPFAISSVCLGGAPVERIWYGGRPFFPIGIYRHPAGELTAEVLDDLAPAGFNCLLVPPNTKDEVLDEIARRGIVAIVTISDGMVLTADQKEARSKELASLVQRLKDHPALLGWEGPDEPLWNWKGRFMAEGERPTWEFDQKTQNAIYSRIDALKDGYALLKSLDPKHPIFLNFAPRSEVEELRWFTSAESTRGYRSDGRAAADVFGVDIYPVPGGRGNNGYVKGVLTPSIAAVGSFTRRQREIAGKSPIYIVLQGCGIAEWSKEASAERRPTLAEERFMAFQAVANGANGILWWGTNYIQPDSILWQDIKSVVRQLAAMQPVLAEGERAPANCSSPQIELIRYVWKNHNYIIAVNASSRPAQAASIVWPAMKRNRINVLFEGRTIPASGRIIDYFGPYDVHIYADDFSSSVSSSEKVRAAYGLPLDAEPFKGKSPSQVARLLTEMGIGAVCACPEDQALIRELHRVGIKAYVEMSVFSGRRHWETHPESRPINADGEPIAEPSPGYCGVCPNQDWLRKEIIEKVRRKFILFEYDGLWLDFIRYAGKWEQKAPALEESCFCNICLDRFQKAAGIAFPVKSWSTKEKAHWILSNHRDEWTAFKCRTIADFVGEIKAAMRELNHEAILGIFNVPWRQSDFDGAITRIFGQDIGALAEHVDVFSPMVYHEMCHFPMRWIAEYADYAWGKTDRRIWPIVQVCDEPVKMSPEDVYRTIRAAINADGSSGVMLFTFGHLLQDPEKMQAAKLAFRHFMQ